ncbi:MAG: hypothetical protein HY720_17130 [Planctomycetes bacterium]|nr:hypothetical protein [Planctomycetota bacterium]
MTGLDILHLALALVTILVVAAPLLLGREVDYSLEPPKTDEDASELAARRAAALEAIRDLDFEHAAGKISDADHAAARARHVQEAAGALRAIEESQAKEWAAWESRIQARRAELRTKSEKR